VTWFHRPGRVRRGLLALAALTALLSLFRPWSAFSTGPTVIETTQTIFEQDTTIYGGTRIGIEPGSLLIFPGVSSVSFGTAGAMRVLAPLLALGLAWALRRRRWALARAVLLAAAAAPGLAGGWGPGGPTIWLVAVVLAALGTGLVALPAAPTVA
jgi:MYXO-CTERM domain-containing protein